MTMKKAFLTVFLMVIVAMSVAQAQTFTLKLDNEFAAMDIQLDRVGPLEVGIAGAVDYFLERSSFEDLDIDLQDFYVGPMAKWHFTPEDSVIDPYVGFAVMIENGKLDHLRYEDIPKVWEAGVNVYINNTVGIGLAYQHCDQFSKNDRLMLSLPVRF